MSDPPSIPADWLAPSVRLERRQPSRHHLCEVPICTSIAYISVRTNVGRRHLCFRHFEEAMRLLGI